MATRYQFVDDSGETRLAGFLIPEPGGSNPFAQVKYTNAAINPWTGDAIPFDTVVIDPAGLWDAVGSQFVAAVAGYYLVVHEGTVLADVPANSTPRIFGQVSGQGANPTIHVGLGAGTGTLVFPALTGYTFMDVGDSVSLHGDPTGGTFQYVAGSFSIQYALAA